jgi:hypothetical protein
VWTERREGRRDEVIVSRHDWPYCVFIAALVEFMNCFAVSKNLGSDLVLCQSPTHKSPTTTSRPSFNGANTFSQSSLRSPK